MNANEEKDEKDVIIHHFTISPRLSVNQFSSDQTVPFREFLLTVGLILLLDIHKIVTGFTRFLVPGKLSERINSIVGHLSLVVCYKIVFGLCNIDFELITLTKLYKYYFFMAIVSLWNSMPKDIVEAGSLELNLDQTSIFFRVIAFME